MGSRDRRKRDRHANMLQPSVLDTVALAQAVEERFLRLCGDYLRLRGVEMPIPKSLDGDMLLWRRMRVRHKRGDYRNTEAEVTATRSIAQWTLDVNCELRNQPKQQLDWG